MFGNKNRTYSLVPGDEDSDNQRQAPGVSILDAVSTVLPFCAEVVSTGILLFAIVSTAGTVGNGPVEIAIAVGSTVSLLGFCQGTRCKSDMNPVITLTLFFDKVIQGRMNRGNEVNNEKRLEPDNAARNRLCVSLIGQFTGAFLGAYIAAHFFLLNADAYCAGVIKIQTGTSTSLAFAAEMLGTFLLLHGVLQLSGTDTVAPDANAPAVVGGLLAALHTSIGPLTGCSINPARWMATMLVAATVSDSRAGSRALCDQGADSVLFLVAPFVACVLVLALHGVGHKLQANQDKTVPASKTNTAPPITFQLQTFGK